MEANLHNLANFIEQPRHQFAIPVYQRNYDWTEIQCAQLLKDIYEVARNKNLASHFVGSIVFIKDSVYMTSRKTVLTIIDGQQRLTTLTLLLLSLSHSSGENGNKELADEILEDYIINKKLDEEEKIKLRPVKKDDSALRYLISNDTNPFLHYSRIIENYRFFRQNIPADDIELILEGIRKLFFVEISLERGKDDPQRIFESLNSTGLDLSAADLIRNYVLMDLEHTEQNRIYETYWKWIEEYCTEQKSKQTRVSLFVRDFLTLKFKQIAPQAQVFQWFRQKFDFSGQNVSEKLPELEALLKEMKRFASYYDKFINPENEEDRVLRQNLSYINRLEINVAYPFLLAVYHDYSVGTIDKESLIDILELVQSFSWRRFICGLETKALNKIYMTLYQNIDKENYRPSLELSLIRKTGQQKFPTDSEVREHLKTRDFYNIQTKNRIYYLERLENFKRNIPLNIEANEKATTEHILPQNPDKEWKFALGEQLKVLSEKYLHTIANLTISGNNGELGNKSFQRKRDAEDFGYKATGYWLNNYLAGTENWGEREILERLDIITERTLQIWKYPETKEPPASENLEETNIFDIESATNKQPAYFLFFDKRYESRYFTDILQGVAETLFGLESERFFEEKLADKIKLTDDKSTLSRAIQVSPSYFIEGHGNANAIIKRIKILLEAFTLYDELYVKFDN